MSNVNGQIIKKFDNWNEFDQYVEENMKKDNARKSPGYSSSVLFRGQAISSWNLESTLDRFIRRTANKEKSISVVEYFRAMLAVYPAFASHTGLRFSLPQPDSKEYSDSIKRIPWRMLGYEFAIHLRHHGFPSPLLDWTRSPYVAAFFAFNNAPKDTDVAIYSYQAYVGAGKSSFSHRPRINDYGPYVITHDRHFRQQAEYTACTVQKEGDIFYASHEDAAYGNDQDILIKIQLPSNERRLVMRKLDQMNINAFSLFGNQEGLADMLAYRELELELDKG